jgi:hypothetical protein
MATKKPTIIAGTLQTDARSGGIKKSSGVVVLPLIAESELPGSVCRVSTTHAPIIAKCSHSVSVSSLCITAWAQVRDEKNLEVDWLIAGYDNGSKTNITVISKGNGGVEACAAALLENEPCYGGCRFSNGRFKHFYHAGEISSAMKKGRASMHKNGVLNVMEGCDGEMKMEPGATEDTV